MYLDEILLDRPDLLEEIAASEGFLVSCQNFLNTHEIIQAPCRWFNSVSDMFSGLLDDEDNSSDTASDESGDRVVNGLNDEESVAAMCNKPEDEPAKVIPDKTSSGSVEVDGIANPCDLNNSGLLDDEDNSSATASDESGDRVVNGLNDEESVAAMCNKPEDEPAKVVPDKTSSGSVEVDGIANPCDLNNSDNEFILSEAHENEEITKTNSSHYSSLKKTDETCTYQESTPLQACSSNEGDEPAKVDNLEPYVQLQEDAALEKIDILNITDVADLENEVEDEFQDVDLQYTDDEDYDLTLASYSENKNNPHKKKFGAFLIPKLRWLKAKKHDHNVQCDTDKETHDTHGFAQSAPFYMKLLDDSSDSDWELL